MVDRSLERTIFVDIAFGSNLAVVAVVVVIIDLLNVDVFFRHIDRQQQHVDKSLRAVAIQQRRTNSHRK
jgi:hypothetical protein